MKYVVRYELEGFVEKEYFETLQEAKKYCNEIITTFTNHLVDIQLYEIQ